MSHDAIAATVAVPLTLEIGNVVAERYVVRGLLGAGGMGAVYHVWDRELDEEIALKVIAPEIAASATALVRFRREVKLARRVTHQNVARMFDLGTHGPLRFLTMELVVGKPLSVLYPATRAPLPEALRIGGEVARGLAVAHAAGVVHRDLKPDNVLLAGERVVLTDFGIARLADDARDRAELMKTGGVVGTPAYMAPEQVEGGAVDGRTDTYALGVLLFELLTGTLPFAGDTPVAMVAARLTRDAPDLRTRAPDVPESVALLVARALRRKREDRPDAQTVLAEVDALRGVRDAPYALQRLPNLTSAALPRLDASRTVAVMPLDADAESATIAADLAAAVADALSRERGLKVLPPASLRGGGAELAKGADLVVQGGVRVAQGRVRARARLLDVSGQQLWADQVEGVPSDPFALEDALVDRVRAAAKKHAHLAGSAGPADPEAKKELDRAVAELNKFILPHVQAGVAILEAAVAKYPGEPYLMAYLGSALQRVWGQTGARDAAMFARAEELSLRAIEEDPEVYEAYATIAGARLLMGELRASLRATNEVLRRAPLHATAHLMLGRLLCDSGHVDPGMQRLELATRLEPNNVAIHMEMARTHALLGDRAAAERVIVEANARGGPMSMLLLQTRLAVWWNDRALAKITAERIEGQSSGASWELAGQLMRAVERGEPLVEMPSIVAPLTSEQASPRHRGLMLQIVADYMAYIGETEAALGAIEAGARLPTVDLFWLDRCPALGALRADPRFAQARAGVAARAAELWG